MRPLNLICNHQDKELTGKAVKASSNYFLFYMNPSRQVNTYGHNVIHDTNVLTSTEWLKHQPKVQPFIRFLGSISKC